MPAPSSANADRGPSDHDEPPPLLLDRLCDTDADIVYFPVRHHSPTCAWLLGKLIERSRPAAVLIEGPSDYNEHIDELLLDHELPIAIYSYFRGEAGSRGAYYPLCDYSPEWVAVQTGSRTGATVRLIDAPWRISADLDRRSHRYADAEMRSSRYVAALCERMHVDDFDDLWDKLVESIDTLSLADYMRRVHALCINIREWEEEIAESDRLREAFMAEQVRQARADCRGKLLVVTGGFHSAALMARIEGYACGGIDDSPDRTPPVVVEAGVCLTSYSYERLDQLTGYEAGMPSPGFYEHAWLQRQVDAPRSHRPLLERLVSALRARRQILSTADLIALETTAHALAALRGRDHVWRRDLIDAVTSTLIKDELEYGCASPFLEAVHDVLRGERRGRLAAATRVPPLVTDIRRQLEAAGLRPGEQESAIALDLLDEGDRAKSRLLHRLRLLSIRGYARTGGVDFLARQRTERLSETWRIDYTPEFDASCIEAARWGTSLVDAASACLIASAGSDSTAADAAQRLIEAAQAGIETLTGELVERIAALIGHEPQFGVAARALHHLIYLYCYDEALGTSASPAIGSVLNAAYGRSIWLVELLGADAGPAQDLVAGMRAILDAAERVGEALDLDRDELVAILTRVEANPDKPAPVRGAAAGILWVLAAASAAQILSDLRQLVDPNELGDFLTGLFAVAREVAQRDPDLVETIDRLVTGFEADDFHAALPALRLAFTYFTPREKHHMLSTLFAALGDSGAPLAELSVSVETAAEALALEDRVFEAIAKYGLNR